MPQAVVFQRRFKVGGVARQGPVTYSYSHSVLERPWFLAWFLATMASPLLATDASTHVSNLYGRYGEDDYRPPSMNLAVISQRIENVCSGIILGGSLHLQQLRHGRDCDSPGQPAADLYERRRDRGITMIK